MEVGTKPFSTGKVATSLSLVLTSLVLRVASEALGLHMAVLGNSPDNLSALFGVQDFSQLFAPSGQPFCFFSADCLAISSRTCVA